ncbi:hypothetical protein HYH02_001546 [Chlamydomonas schloesseri]|uniref:Serine aminopeptidase S33 domain-containing protein n=1 Tax=Chlamydomonas schloesseri TaxID=2026947 RepID=A0A836BB76_9CHLO|nr:hypothetical protein HYH02_001546 [Chlamydomonas schloesseri]|eukprot:KAG2453322.1 hypothetical protein HYH02_001546 [Chlamydomonas schloesseri]
MGVPEARRVAFTNPRGQKLAGLFVDAGSEDVVILCHGYAATKDGFHLPAIAEALALQAGTSSLRFDFAGNGESEGQFSFGGYYREVEDLHAAVGFVRRELHKHVAAVVGHSKGGNVVLLYGSVYPHEVPLIINVAGRGVMARGIQERFGADIQDRLATAGAVEQSVKADGGRVIKYMLTKEAVDERMKMDMFAEATKIKAEVLTVHGSADRVIPIEDGRAWDAHIPRHRLIEVEGADHNFRAAPEHKQQVVEAIVAKVVEAAGRRRSGVVEGVADRQA